MSKALFKRILRRFGIIKLSDNIRFNIMRIRNKKDNVRFKKENPNIPIPPDYLLYEAHQLKYRSYFVNGLSNAKALKKLFEKYINLDNKKVLDWGCGPARIVRHFPGLLPKTEFYGTDYNDQTILWNKEHIKNVLFFNNKINPPTNFENNLFDGIYGLSIFTHLSEENHINWINELSRIANKNAILILTTHGDSFKEKLLKNDQFKFNSNILVVQGNTLEGHRTFAAFHPPNLMRKLFEEKFKVLEHLPGQKESWGISQDKWILKKE